MEWVLALLRQGAGGVKNGVLVLVLCGVKHGELAHREYRVSD